MIDLLKLSPVELEKFFHIQSLLWRQQSDAAKIRVLRDYYSGSMPVLLTQRQQEFIGKFLTEGEFEFSHNTIKSVIDTLRERLSVSGFSVNGKALDEAQADANSAEGQLAALFWAWWQENRFDAQQIRLHRRALRDSKSYVMVSFDSKLNRPVFTLHPVDDGTVGVTCHRDPENPDTILYLCKYFYTFNPLEPGATGIARKTIYLPYEIRKYIANKKGEWERYSDPEDNNVWPLPWVDAQGQPLGVALIEFENPGGSEVAQIMGLQDGLNKSWLDLIAAADASGFPILVEETAGELPFGESADDDDIEGDDELIVAPGRMIETAGHIHRIEGANLQQLIDVIWVFVMAIAAVSRTPSYYLRPVGGGEVPSGEALKQLESGLVSRAEERQLIFGQGWADVMTLAYKLQRTFGTGKLPDIPKLKVETIWKSAEIRNDLTNAQTAQLHQALKVPDDQVWALLGYSSQEIAKWKATQRSDQAAVIANVTQAMQRTQQQQAQAQANGQPANGAQQQNGNGAQA